MAEFEVANVDEFSDCHITGYALYLAGSYHPLTESDKAAGLSRDSGSGDLHFDFSKPGPSTALYLSAGDEATKADLG